MKKLREPKTYKFVRRAPEIDEGNRRVEGLDAGTSLVLESTVLSREVLAGREFYTVTMRDVRLEQCDLANLRTRSLTLVRVEFLNCRMTGWSGGEAECRDVLISGGDQRYCTFRYSK
ncbi:MAG TPA: hypothetical protein VFQ91_10475, partial [Bryobacteraceae bacterium]|nr:hypothetical protein [Bryobacteraceae bacterium]